MAARQSKMGRLLKLLSTTRQNLSGLQGGQCGLAKPYRFVAESHTHKRYKVSPSQKPLLQTLIGLPRPGMQTKNFNEKYIIKFISLFKKSAWIIISHYLQAKSIIL